MNLYDQDALDGRPPAGGSGGARAAVGNRGVGANNISRTPSMSRAQAWSSTPVNRLPSAAGGSMNQPRLLPATNAPSRTQIPLHVQGRPSVQNPSSRSQLQQFVRQQSSSQQRPNLRNSSVVTAGQRNQAANALRNTVAQQHPNRGNWFGNQFWANHNYQPNYWRQGENLWGYANWASANSWLGWGEGTPLYYEDGYLASPPEQYVSQQQLSSVPAPSENPDWLPLGVFALTSSETNSPQPTMFFQLALKKDGTLAGTYYNQAVDQLSPIDGIVDRDSQKAVWQMAMGQNSPIFEDRLI